MEDTVRKIIVNGVEKIYAPGETAEDPWKSEQERSESAAEALKERALTAPPFDQNNTLTIDLTGEDEESGVSAEYTAPDAVGESGSYTVTGLDPESVYEMLEGGSLIWLSVSGDKALVDYYSYSDDGLTLKASGMGNGDSVFIAAEGDIKPITDLGDIGIKPITPGGKLTMNLPSAEA